MKPENCFRVARSHDEHFIKVLDFGLAKVFGDEREPQSALSTTGKVFGTPEFMSPEQCRGETADERSDVYSVGCMLFEMLTGDVPFSNPDSHLATLVMHIDNPVPLPSGVAPLAGITEQMDALLLRALEKDKELRFQSMKDLAEAILAVPSGETASRSSMTAVQAQRWIDEPNAKLALGLGCLSAGLAAALTAALLAGG
jgi:serine/threonine-protein kinase